MAALIRRRHFGVPPRPAAFDLPLTVLAEAKSLRATAGSVILSCDHVPHILLALTAGRLRIETRPPGRPQPTTSIEAEADAPLAASLLARGGYPVAVLAETDIDAIALSRPRFERLILNSPDLRGHLFTACARHIAALVSSCGGTELTQRPEGWLH